MASRLLKCAVAAIILAGATGQAPSGFRLKSVSVELPSGSFALPPGPSVDVVAANCLTCHSAGMIMTQPGLAKATWEAEVTKMIQLYKAPIEKSNIPAIVTYLSAVKGT